MKRHTITLSAAGLTAVVATAVKPDIGIDASTRYSHVVGHAGLEGLSGFVFFLSGALFVLAGVMAYADRPRGRGGRVSAVGAVMTALIGLWMAASLSAFAMSFALLVDPHVPRATALRLIGGEVHPWQNLYDLTLLCLLAGPPVLAVGLRRAGLTSWWPLAAYVVGIVAYGAFEFTSTIGAVATLLVCTVALALLGRALDRAPDRATARTGAPNRAERLEEPALGGPSGR